MNEEWQRADSAPKRKEGYVVAIVRGIYSLVRGLKVTFVEFFTRKTTECYPENRATLVMFDRFRGTLAMPCDADGNHRCIACGLCAATCPNGTLRVESETVTDPETGKKKKILLTYEYNLGSCMFCQLCVNVCPTQAICFDTAFEHAVFTRNKLVKILNRQIQAHGNYA
ncbi:MAG: 4Fe-4S dicluster domain-containing protein [Tannerella sp.]|jgi:NADH-quinone oxidoreductase subunit I|nr:4Fe-4S dicluster domain-containing protein [Tannerella sp.]